MNSAKIWEYWYRNNDTAREYYRQDCTTLYCNERGRSRPKVAAEMHRELARRVWGKRAREEDEPERTVTRRATTSQYTPEQYHRASDRGIT